MFLYLPKGTLFKADETVQNYDRTSNDFFNLHFSSKDYVYKVGDSQVKCLNCPADENEYGDVESAASDTIPAPPVAPALPSQVRVENSVKTSPMAPARAALPTIPFEAR